MFSIHLLVRFTGERACEDFGERACEDFGERACEDFGERACVENSSKNNDVNFKTDCHCV